MKVNTQQQCFSVSLSPSFSSSPAISLCVLRGLESRGKPSFLEPYLSCSLPSCKHLPDASRHTEINIMSNFPCIFLFNVCYRLYFSWSTSSSSAKLCSAGSCCAADAFHIRFTFRWLQGMIRVLCHKIDRRDTFHVFSLLMLIYCC